MKTMKTLAAVAALALGTAFLAAAASAPKSVLHVITVKWKADATDAQKQAALDGVKAMAAKFKGITNTWTKTLKVQGEGYNAVIAIEFKDEAAFKAYADDPAHKEWEKVYLPIRQQSTTHDVTN